jgi:N-methylhydantoinase B/oxoprolinase/acetone carboxylase alpha subunit
MGAGLHCCAATEYPGSSGTRNLLENLADLKAQIAANQRGIAMLNALMDEMGEEVVVAYMRYIQVCVFGAGGGAVICRQDSGR